MNLKVVKEIGGKDIIINVSERMVFFIKRYVKIIGVVVFIVVSFYFIKKYGFSVG